MRRALALSVVVLGVPFAFFACDARFDFDADALATGGAGSGGASGSTGSAGAGAVDCKSRCQAAGLICLNSLQLCVECDEDEDCATRGGGRCGVSGQTEHRCLGCLSDNDCESDEQCDSGTHSCVTECSHFGDSVCTAQGLECNPWHFYCAACYDSDDCENVGLRCSVGDARCVQCVDDDECGNQTGKLCDPVLLRCVVCRDSFDCPAGRPICDPILHTCR